MFYKTLLISIVVFAATTCLAQTFPPLPEGNTGIASRHPGDVAIGADTAVVFADDFESYASPAGLDANWNGGVYHNVQITTASGNVYAGKQAVEFISPKQTIEWSNTVARSIDHSKRLDQMFLRYYTKFDTSFRITGSSHNGGGMSASYFVNGNATPGIPADGYNKFLIEFESWCADSTETLPGSLNVYVYHPTQRSQWGDHWFPDGTVLPFTYLPGDFGTGFVKRPTIVCQLGKWYCCEVMLKANTVGVKDGRVACWLDGVLIADFQNLRLRDTDTLKIDRFNLSLHCGTNPKNETYKYYDNVVAAKSYIGPMYTPGTVRRQPDGSIQSRSLNPVMFGDRISFAIDKLSRVAVDVYTIQGRIAGHVANQTYGAGNHSIEWNKPAGSGAGLYLTRIVAGDKTAVGKVAVDR